MSDQLKSWIVLAKKAGLELNVELGLDSVPNIKQVEYRRLKTFGSFENETISAVVDVPIGQDPDAALSALKEWVEERLNVSSEFNRAKSELFDLYRQKRSAEQDVEMIRNNVAQCKDQWERAKAFLEKHGVKLPDEELPF